MAFKENNRAKEEEEEEEDAAMAIDGGGRRIYEAPRYCYLGLLVLLSSMSVAT